MIVFTNGCFDVLHPGHIELLRQARALGSKLIVGINSDESVRRIKGNGRPIFNEAERASMLRALEFVDDVRVFGSQTPEELIRELMPDVLVKGGDWKENEIVGAEIVRSNGGKVVSLPLIPGYSTTTIVERLTRAAPRERPTDTPWIDEHVDVFQNMREDADRFVRECAELIGVTFRSGGKIMICGNGGSAADAQHLAAELVGRYESDRRGLPAIALTTDTSALTAIANDYDFERVFARQIEALGRPGDCLLAISTSGNSSNVIAAVMSARNLGIRVAGLTGSDGKKLAALCDLTFMAPSTRTSRIQEAHIAVGHALCERIEQEFVVRGR